MNLFKLCEQLTKADPDFSDHVSLRRSAIKNMVVFSAKAVAVSIPVTLNILLKKAYGQTASAAVLNVLNFLLKLKYFEAAFYRKGLASTAIIIPPAERVYLNNIAAQEAAHVNYLKKVLGSSAVAQPPDSAYDFTAGGVYAGVTSNYELFLTVAQILEDTGVRACKGQLGVLLQDQTYLTAVLNIHSVEARHAAAIRYLRLLNHNAGTTEPWITGTAEVANDTGLSAADANYAGENTTVQAGVDIAGLRGVSGTITISSAVEAFDEPLSMAEVLDLVAPFGVL